MPACHQAVRRFGDIIVNAREQSLDDIVSDFDGGTNNTGFASLLNSSKLGPETAQAILDLFLFRLLDALQDAEQEGVSIHLFLNGEGGPLNELTDGLAGEFATERGFIGLGSKYAAPD